MSRMIRVGLVGTGGMAHAHVRRLKPMRGVKLVAVADVDEARAQEFAREFEVSEVYGSQTALLKEAGVDAMINVTPDAYHASLTLEALDAGKHVLCEKPLATNYADAKKMADRARKKGLINMVNFSYRDSSAVQRAHKMVQRGDIGRPLHFEASYLQSWLSSLVWGDWRTQPGWLWRLSTEHQSKGVLGDVGVHILDLVSFPLGAYAGISCQLRTFDKAEGGKINGYRLDANDSAVMHAEMKNGALGVVHTTRWATGHANSLELRIFGDEGALAIDLDKSYTQLQVCLGEARHKVEWETVTCADTPNILKRFIRSVRTGTQDQPDFVQGAAIQQVLDACFTSDETGQRIRIP